MYDLSERDTELLITILRKHLKHAEVWVFGSRHKGNNKPYSDIDLAIICENSSCEIDIYSMKDDFQFSDISIQVDIHDYHLLNETFQKIIDEEHSVLLVVSE